VTSARVTALWSTIPTDTYILSAQPSVPTGTSIKPAKLHQKGYFLMSTPSVAPISNITNLYNVLLKAGVVSATGTPTGAVKTASPNLP
jgi:pre-mRNA cleavage complex 2 protein Pcf11